MDTKKLSDEELEQVVGGAADEENKGRGNGVILVGNLQADPNEHNVMQGSPMDKYELVP